MPDQDAIEVLTADHREVERVYAQIEQPTTLGRQREDLIRDLVRALSVHSFIEKEVLYPAIAGQVHDGEPRAAQAVEEHDRIESLLDKVDRFYAESPQMTAELDELMGQVRSHVEEEEAELFPAVRAALGQEELEELGRRLVAAKAKAPTHPHPHAPGSPGASRVAAAGARLVDKARDAVRSRLDKA